MTDEFRDHIVPIAGSSRIDRLGEGPAGTPRTPRTGQTIAGRIISVRRATRHAEGGHALDVSVGGDDFTEIVLRVPSGSYSNLEGKRGLLYVED